MAKYRNNCFFDLKMYKHQKQGQNLKDECFLKSRLVGDEKELELIIDKKDKEIDRDLSDLNFSIRDELQIAGVLIWKSINSLDRINFNNTTNLVEHPFMTLYFASQGIERIQKIFNRVDM